jgi:hypothetical protein
MNFKSALKSFLTNKWVLNIVALIALLNVIGYLTIGNFDAVVYFIIIAVLTRYFSKNMIIVLGVPIIFVSLLISKNVISEGMENKSDESNTSDESKTNDANKKNSNNSNKKESMDNLDSKNKNNKQDQKTSQGLPITPIDEDSTTTTSAVASTDAVVNGNESFEVGRGKRRTGAQIDYAATVEDAYDELNKVLGSDGVKKLTDDTQRLMKQQMQLAESMKSMTPLIQGMGPMIKTAKELMKGMGDNKEDFGNVLKLAEQFDKK